NTGTALLEYVVTEDKTYLFVLSKQRLSPARDGLPVLKVYTLDIKQKELTDQVERFRRRVSNLDFGFQELARELYELLLGPAHAELQNKTKLIIVPDGALWELPFQALQPQAQKFLIENCSISYAPSLTVLLEMIKPRVKGSTRSASLLAFGNPAISKMT